MRMNASNVMEFGDANNNANFLNNQNTLTGTMILDVNSSNTALLVTGGNSGNILARFRRDIGSTGIIDLISSDGVVKTIWDYETGTAWAVGTSGTSLMFVSGSTGTNPTTNRVLISSSGVVTFSNYGAGTLQTNSSGVISASSDRSLKDIEGLFTRGLVDLRKFLPKLYRWKPNTPFADPMLYAGFVAQEVYLGIPEAIGIGGDGFLTLQDRPILAAHHNAILELDDRVRQLELAA